MPNVWVTLDRIDGTSTVKGPVDASEIDLHGLLFYLNTAGVAGVTFTRANPLRSIGQWRCHWCGATNEKQDTSCKHCNGG